MIIFKDAVSENKDELLSDSYDFKEVDGVIYEADCAMIQIDAVNVDTGANASAEEAEEGLEDAATKVNNIVHSFRLQSTSFDKAGYGSYLKGYMKKVLAHLKAKGAPESEIDTFKKGAAAFSKKVLGSFKDWEFYTGESMDVDGMVVLLNYRADGITPYVAVWKHGLEQMKV
ncbi:putative translationally-controlled tumor protein [Rosellinia necatrix]|uniref:Translationally-controlled tumor protein homolog n=1 Tax=Rosellinia necatrix TaxID=77044 RepID=A0A1W2TEJ8_ROSNE|nr:putative translationally-controlled tumor protein [Rosellinia necatrix]